MAKVKEKRGLSRVFQDRFSATNNNDPSNVTAQGPDNKIGYRAPTPPKRKR